MEIKVQITATERTVKQATTQLAGIQSEHILQENFEAYVFLSFNTTSRNLSEITLKKCWPRLMPPDGNCSIIYIRNYKQPRTSITRGRDNLLPSGWNTYQELFKIVTIKVF